MFKITIYSHKIKIINVFCKGPSHEEETWQCRKDTMSTTATGLVKLHYFRKVFIDNHLSVPFSTSNKKSFYFSSMTGTHGYDLTVNMA